MQVQFQRSTYGVGIELYVPAGEFARASRDETEFQNLAASVHAFSLYCGLNYRLQREEYDRVSRWAGDGGGDGVAFTVCASDKTRLRWREIHVVRGGRRQKVYFSPDDGVTDSTPARPSIPGAARRGQAAVRRRVAVRPQSRPALGSASS